MPESMSRIFRSSYIDRSQLVFFASEFMSTTLLICVGCMGSTEDDPIKSGLLFGFTTMAMLGSFGYISGAHSNPAVTFACWMFSYMSSSRALIFVVGQFLGAVFGYFLLTLVLPDTNGLCVVEPKGTTAQSFWTEFILTSAVLLGWCAVWDCRNKYTLDSVAIRIGFSLAACIFMGIKVTGAALNPARTLAPAIFQGDLSHIWLYFGSQFLAGLVVPMIWKLVFKPRVKVLLAKKRSAPDENADAEYSDPDRNTQS